MAVSVLVLHLIFSGATIAGRQCGPIQELVAKCFYKASKRNHSDRLSIELRFFCLQITLIYRTKGSCPHVLTQWWANYGPPSKCGPPNTQCFYTEMRPFVLVFTSQISVTNQSEDPFFQIRVSLRHESTSYILVQPSNKIKF